MLGLWIWLILIVVIVTMINPEIWVVTLVTVACMLLLFWVFNILKERIKRYNNRRRMSQGVKVGEERVLTLSKEAIEEREKAIDEWEKKWKRKHPSRVRRDNHNAG